jgi:ABC-type polysaccharide transport system permease subunit
MRNYQTLTVIGGIITILIVLAVGFLFSVGNIMNESFGNYTKQYGSQSTINQYNQTKQTFASGLTYFSAAIPVGVFGSVAAMVLVFVIKDRFKPLGIILIVLGVI